MICSTSVPVAASSPALLAKLPVVGFAGGWLDERGGIRKAAEETEELLTHSSA